jgi:uncharacterized RmlC-like cupin family protein
VAVTLKREQFVEDKDYEPGITINWGANGDSVGTVGLMGMYVVIPPGGANPAHAHMNAEALAYVMSGSARLVSGGEEFLIGPQTFAYTPPGEVHQWFNRSESEPIVILGIYGGVNRVADVETVFPNGKTPVRPPPTANHSRAAASPPAASRDIPQSAD